MMYSASDHKDQATGLRQLFGQQSLPVHVLTCPQRPALALPLAQWICHDLADRGHGVAWLDEMDLNEREDWPLPTPVKFDLGQALGGHVKLAAALRALRPQLWYGLSCQTRQLQRVERNLQTRLLGSGVRFDTLVVAAHPNVQTSRYAPAVHHTVIVDAETEHLQRLVTWMMRMESADQAPLSWHVILVGKGPRSKAALKWLEDATAARLSQPVQWLAWAAPKTLSVPLAQAWSGQLDLMEALMQHFLSH